MNEFSLIFAIFEYPRIRGRVCPDAFLVKLCLLGSCIGVFRDMVNCGRQIAFSDLRFLLDCVVANCEQKGCECDILSIIHDATKTTNEEEEESGGIISN